MHKIDCDVIAGLRPFNETPVTHHWYFGVLGAKDPSSKSYLTVFDTPQAIQRTYLRSNLSEKVWPWLLTLFFLSGFWITCAVKAHQNANR
jgi:hypothetical protein